MLDSAAMALIAQSALLLVLLVVSCFAPGFFFVRRLRWTPLEKLCASIGLSVILLYLVTWSIDVVGGIAGGGHISTGLLITSSVLYTVLGIAAYQDVLRLFHSLRAKHALLGYVFLFLWTFLLLGMIRVYSGAGWGGDWLEHFHRTLFFIWRLPANISFIHTYPLPARPPLMNIVAAGFLAQTQDRFELFQIVFSFLNLLIFLPCCLMLPLITRDRRPRTVPLVALFALNPMLMENVTYAWTKALAGFFVLLGLAFYLAAWRKRDQSRMVAAFVSLAAGILVHYSAGPYVVFLALHYALWLFWRRRNRWKELAAIVVTCTALLMTWFAWSIETYGSATFLSNTSITSSQRYQGSNRAKIIANAYDSLVPFFIRDWSLANQFQQPNRTGRLRDGAFLVYQTNMIFAAGMVGGPVVLWQLFKRFRRKSWDRIPERAFWIAFVVFCPVVGILVVGERDEFGVAHITLLALEALALTLLVDVVYNRRILGRILLAGCLIDFSLGIFLNAHVQSMENVSSRLVFNSLEFSGSRIGFAAANDDALSRVAWSNWYGKHALALSEQWLKDLPERNGSDPRFQAIWPEAKASLSKMEKEDATDWGGWFSRHSGEIQYIGDHIAGSVGEWPVAATLLGILVALILTVMRMPQRSFGRM